MRRRPVACDQPGHLARHQRQQPALPGPYLARCLGAASSWKRQPTSAPYFRSRAAPTLVLTLFQREAGYFGTIGLGLFRPAAGMAAGCGRIYQFQLAPHWRAFGWARACATPALSWGDSLNIFQNSAYTRRWMRAKRSYDLVNLGAQLKGWSMQVNAQNLLDEWTGITCDAGYC